MTCRFSRFLPINLREQEGGNRGREKRDQDETERVGEDGSIAAFAARESVQKLQNAPPEESGQRQNRPQLDDDAVHFPEAILEIDLEQRLGDAEMRGRADGQEFGQALENSEHDREEVVVHPAWRMSGREPGR